MNDITNLRNGLSHGDGATLHHGNKRAKIGEVAASFEDGTHGTQVLVAGQRLAGGGLAVRIDMLVGGGDRLAASIRDVKKCSGGVAWVRVSRDSVYAGGQPTMEVFMGAQAPPLKDGYHTLALVKLENKMAAGGGEEVDPRFQVFVTLFDGKSNTFTVRPETMVEQLKKMIYDKIGFPAEQQRLIWGGKQLEDGNPLRVYGIQDGATINLLTRLRGG